MDAAHIVADGYDRMGEDFSVWNASRPPEGRRWFLSEVLERLPLGSDVLELGCGPGTDATALSDGRRYIGLDLSPAHLSSAVPRFPDGPFLVGAPPPVQLSIARRTIPDATFLVGDLTALPFASETFDGIVAFYAFNHVPSNEIARAIAVASACLRPGGRLMLGGLPTSEVEDRVEEWLGVPMFFAGIDGEPYDNAVRGASFVIEFSEIRFTIQESWGLNRPRWLIASKP